MQSKLIKKFIFIGGLLALSAPAWSASFDCAKARKPLEKLICSSPELDAADSRMGDVYKQINAGFPLKGYVLATQRVFLSGYAYCMQDSKGKPSSGPDAVQRCVKAAQQRTAELQSLVQAKAYVESPDKFSHDSLAVLVYPANGHNRIRLWGNWMPDAHNPRPFPDGFLCDIDEELKPVKGGFATDSTDDAVFAISDAAVTISGYIMCTPRNGISEGTYRRVR